MKAWWLVAMCACSGSHAQSDAPFVDATRDASTDAPAPFGFQQPFAILAGIGPDAVAIGDVDRDGDPDILVANQSPPSIAVFLRTADTFTHVADVSTAAVPTSLAVADINGDGKLDLVVITDKAAVFLNTTTTPGSPTFSAEADFALESLARGYVSIGDLNADGRPDLVEPYFCSTTTLCLSVLLDATPPGATTPAFESRADIQTSERGFVTAIGDLDGDAVPDIFLDYRAEHVGVFVNQTSANATAPTLASNDVSVSSSDGQSAVIADFDGDGRNDLAFSNSGLTVLPNTTTAPGSPSFGNAIDLAVPSTMFIGMFAAAADIDGDGKPDLVVADYIGKTVLAYRNEGNLAFGSANVTPVDGMPRALAVGDLNHDGHIDAVTVNGGADTISVLIAH